MLSADTAAVAKVWVRLGGLDAKFRMPAMTEEAVPVEATPPFGRHQWLGYKHLPFHDLACRKNNAGTLNL